MKCGLLFDSATCFALTYENFDLQGFVDQIPTKVTQPKVIILKLGNHLFMFLLTMLATYLNLNFDDGYTSLSSFP